MGVFLVVLFLRLLLFEALEELRLEALLSGLLSSPSSFVSILSEVKQRSYWLVDYKDRHALSSSSYVYTLYIQKLSIKHCTPCSAVISSLYLAFLCYNIGEKIVWYVTLCIFSGSYAMLYKIVPNFNHIIWHDVIFYQSMLWDQW